MQNNRPRRTLRILVWLNLALLLLLLIFGLAFDSTQATRLAPSGFSTTVAAIGRTGASGFIHMSLGLLVGLFALVNLVVALRSGLRRVQIFGSLAFLAILAAGIVGLFFVFTGFQDTGLILGLVPLFLLSVIAYLLELFSLKVSPQPQTG